MTKIIIWLVFRNYSYFSNIYLFSCTRSWLLHVGSLIFVAACRIFHCSMQTLSCSMWDLVPWPGIEPGPLHWECGVLATGPPGKSPMGGLISSPSQTEMCGPTVYDDYGADATCHSPWSFDPISFLFNECPLIIHLDVTARSSCLQASRVVTLSFCAFLIVDYLYFR